MIADSVYLCLTPNALLRTAACSAWDALLWIVSIHEGGHTYKEFRNQGKCGYPCLTPNALLCMAVCTARDALLGRVPLCKAGHTYTG